MCISDTACDETLVRKKYTRLHIYLWTQTHKYICVCVCAFMHACTNDSLGRKLICFMSCFVSYNCINCPSKFACDINLGHNFKLQFIIMIKTALCKHVHMAKQLKTLLRIDAFLKENIWTYVFAYIYFMVQCSQTSSVLLVSVSMACDLSNLHPAFLWICKSDWNKFCKAPGHHGLGTVWPPKILDYTTSQHRNTSKLYLKSIKCLFMMPSKTLCQLGLDPATKL